MKYLSGLLLAFVILGILSCDTKEQLNDFESDDAEAIGDLSNGVGDTINVATKLNSITSKEFSTNFATAGSSCAINFEFGTPFVLTLGSGQISGSFADSDYSFNNWDLSADQPKALASITSADFVNAPTSSDTCDVGNWLFSGKISKNSDSGKVVRHLWRRFEPVESHNFFSHLEFTISDGSGSNTKNIDNLKIVRERWIADKLIMAQTAVTVGTMSSETKTDGAGSFQSTTGKVCVHHLLAQKNSFHELSNVKRTLGFSNFCCHPLLGTDRISVYPEGTDCSAARVVIDDAAHGTELA
jgi:hypothetical protein